LSNLESPFIRNVTDAEFEREVVERSREVPVLVDFWAEWCGPCQVLGPVLEKLAVEGNGRFLLAKVNIDTEPRYAQTFGVRGIPTVIAFRDGTIASEFSGAIPESAVREFLDRVCPSAADEIVARAEARRSLDTGEAEGLFREALKVDANHAAARVGLAELDLDSGKLDEARELVTPLLPGGALSERIEQVVARLDLAELSPEASEAEILDALSKGPERGDLLLELGRLRASQGRFPEALETLLKAAEADRALAEGDAKELMVRIFHVIGVRSELADQYRGKLARLLY
jgi:putative thioredoxin